MAEQNIHVLTYLRDGGAGGGDGVADPEAGGVVGHVGDAAVALLRPAATWAGKYTYTSDTRHSPDAVVVVLVGQMNLPAVVVGGDCSTCAWP